MIYAPNTPIPIFFLEGDQLDATDIVAHNINTQRILKPNNIRPQR